MPPLRFTNYFSTAKLIASVVMLSLGLQVFIRLSMMDESPALLAAGLAVAFGFMLLFQRRHVIDAQRRTVTTVWWMGFPLVIVPRSWADFGEVRLTRHWIRSTNGNGQNTGHNRFIVRLIGRTSLELYRGRRYESARRVADQVAARMGRWVNDGALDRGGRLPGGLGEPLRGALLRTNVGAQLGVLPPPPPYLRAQFGPTGLAASLDSPASTIRVLGYFGVLLTVCGMVLCLAAEWLDMTLRVGGAALCATACAVLLVVTVRSRNRVEMHAGPNGVRLHFLTGRSVAVRDILSANLLDIGILHAGAWGRPEAIALITRDDVVVIGDGCRLEALQWVHSALCVALVLDVLGRPEQHNAGQLGTSLSR